MAWRLVQSAFPVCIGYKVGEILDRCDPIIAEDETMEV